MKHLTFLIALLMCCGIAKAQQTSMTVDNQTPGWLSSKINYSDQVTLTDITVTGYVNSEDLKFLGTLASTRALKRMNLSDCHIVGDTSDKDDVLNENMFSASSSFSIDYLSLPLSIKESTECFTYSGSSAISVDTLVAGGLQMHKIKSRQFGASGYSFGNRGVKNLVLREGVDSIEKSAFIKYTTSHTLNSVSLPSTLKFVGESAFQNQSGISEINLSDSIKSIGGWAFNGTSFSPDTLRLPKSLKEFYTYSFNRAKVIYIGANVTKIHNSYQTYNSSTHIYSSSAFYTYSNALEIHIKAKTPPEFSYTSSTFLEKSVVYVPKGTLSLYRNANYWKSALSIIEEIPVEGVSIVGEDNLHVGEHLKLKASFTPEDATNQDVTWESGDENTLTIASDGTVSGVAYGSATVKVTTTEGGFTDSVSLNVYEHTTGIETIDALSLNVGSTKTLNVKLLPLGKTDGEFMLASSDPDVAKVDANGNVKGVSKGSCVITATTIDGGYTATCTVKVMQPVTEVRLEKHETTLNVGDTEELRAQVSPTDADNKQLVWSSEDESIATVSAEGMVKGVKAGTVRIYAKSADNEELSDYSTVTVLQPVTGITLDQSSITLTSIGATYQLTATVLPEDASNKELRWTSGNASVAYVSGNGSVVAMSDGTTVVMVTTVDGGFLATCKVTVDTSSTGISNISADTDSNVTYYNVSGQRVSLPNGFTIVRQTDGATRKLIVK